MNLNAQPGAGNMTVVTKLIDHTLCNRGGYGEADTDTAAIWRKDRRIHADDLTNVIEQGSAGIAAIDRGIDLDVIHIGPVVDVATPCRNDARGSSASKTKRISDGDDPVSYPCCVGVAKTGVGQRLISLDLKQSEVRPSIYASNDCGQDFSAIENDLDFISTPDHMMIGHDQPFCIDDEARTQGTAVHWASRHLGK